MTHRVQKRVTTLSIKQTRNHPLHTHTHNSPSPFSPTNPKFPPFCKKKYKFSTKRLKSKKFLLLSQKPWGEIEQTLFALVRVQSCNHQQMKKKTKSFHSTHKTHTQTCRFTDETFFISKIIFSLDNFVVCRRWLCWAMC